MEVRAIGSATRHIAIGNQSVTVSIPMGQKKKKKKSTHPKARAGSWESHHWRLKIVFSERLTPYSLKLSKILTRPPVVTVQKLVNKRKGGSLLNVALYFSVLSERAV